MSAIPGIPPVNPSGPELSPVTEASHGATGPPAGTPDLPSRVTLSPRPGVDASDGVWWPRTTDLRVELPLLDVAVHGLTRARIGRLAYERDRWSDAPGRLRTPLGITHLGWFEHSRYPDHVLLSLGNYQRLVLTVLPPGTDGDTAQDMLESAGT